MLDQEIVIERVRVIEVNLFTLYGWQVAQILVVGIMRKVGDLSRPTDFRIALATVVLPEPDPPAMPMMTVAVGWGGI